VIAAMGVTGELLRLFNFGKSPPNALQPEDEKALMFIN
jgi:hypothetical protein